MPFLAPLIPAIPAIGGLLGGLLGGGKPKMSDAERQALQAQLGLSAKQMEAIDRALGYTGEISPYASNFLTSASDFSNLGRDLTGSFYNLAQPGAEKYLGQSNQAFTPALNYWSSILAGGPQGTEALSPEIQRIGAGYNAAQNQINQFAPRGGGRASALGQLPLQRSADVSNLFATMRPMAAQQLSQIGSATGGLGTALTGQIGGLAGSLAGDTSRLAATLPSTILSALSGIGGGAAGTNASIWQNELQRHQLGAQRGGLIGGGIYDILKNLPWFGSKNRPWTPGPPD